jgi:viroplasmin and RNaseH domain-containing protein
MWIIKYLGKRYNSKKFPSYEDARKYVRRLVTKVTGKYDDSYSKYGFQVVAK